MRGRIRPGNGLMKNRARTHTGSASVRAYLLMLRSIVRMYFPDEVVCDFFKAVVGSIPPLTKLRQTLTCPTATSPRKNTPTRLVAAVTRQLWLKGVLLVNRKHRPRGGEVARLQQLCLQISQSLTPPSTEPNGNPMGTQREPNGNPAGTQREPHENLMASQRYPNGNPADSQGQPSDESTVTQRQPKNKPTATHR